MTPPLPVSPSSLSYEGARWWRFDLHTHTPASHDYRRKEKGDWVGDEAEWRRWLESARDAGIHALAITDHDTAEGIDRMREVARTVADAPVIFPGVELSIDGIHMLAIFSPDASRQAVEGLLHHAGIPPERFGDEHAEAKSSLGDVLGYSPEGRRPVWVAAHVNARKGLFKLQGQKRLQVLQNPNLDAIQRIEESETHSEEFVFEPFDEFTGVLQKASFRGAVVLASDAHGPAEFRAEKATWLKMGSPTLEGLRLALDDLGELGPDSMGVLDPNRPPERWIRRVEVHHAQYMGREQPLAFGLSPWMTAVIGGRGTGKSTIVDLLRKCLGRDGELRALNELQSSFEDRMQVVEKRDGPGLLTSETEVLVEYEMNGQLFRARFRARGGAPTVERREGQDWLPDDSMTVGERFPIRLYSQKQLFEMSRQPNVLLGVIDEAPEVGAVSRRHARDVHKSKASEAWAKARAAETEVREESRLVTEREDLTRKIERLESGGHTEALLRDRQAGVFEGDWVDIRTAWDDDLEEVRTALANAVPADLQLPPSLEESPAAAAIIKAHEELREAHRSLVDEIGALLDEAKEKGFAGAPRKAWRAEREDWARQASLARDKLAEAGVSDAESLPHLTAQLRELERKLARIRSRREAVQMHREEGDAALTAYRAEVRSLSEARQRFVDALGGQVKEVQLQIHPLADSSRLEAELEALFGSTSYAKEREALAAHLMLEPWSFDRLDALVEGLRSLAEDGDADLGVALGSRFRRKLSEFGPEKFDDLQFFIPGDVVRVSYPDPRTGRPKSLDQASPGQRTAALLAFVLSHGTEPIVLDQPEDDLDTALIYELVVKRLREVKPQRQVLVVTHNPNIVVHGNAELVVSLDAVWHQTKVQVAGALQDPAVREEICRVMEGGKEALEKRYRRIMAAQP